MTSGSGQVEPVDLPEIVIGYSGGLLMIYVSIRGPLPVWLFIPDGLLSVAAALLSMAHHRLAATSVIIVAYILAGAWFLNFIHSAGT